MFWAFIKNFRKINLRITSLYTIQNYKGMQTRRMLTTSPTLKNQCHLDYVYTFSKYSPFCVKHFDFVLPTKIGTCYRSIHYLMTSSTLLCPENGSPKNAISTAKNKYGLVGQIPLSMAGAQLSVDPAHRSPVVSWQRYG